MSGKALLQALSLCALIGSALNAQVITPAFDPAVSSPHIPPSPVNAAVIDNGLTTTFGYSSSYVAPASSAGSLPSYIAPYSYYAAPEGFPARQYVGLGTSDLFPFHGQPYGHVYDRWTWSGMSGSPPQSLIRYYYPPVP